MMRRLFTRENFSKKDSKDSEDTISINSEWLLEEEEKDASDNKQNSKKNKSKWKKSKKESALKFSNRNYLKSHGRGIPGSKTLFSILKSSTWDLRELSERFQQKEQTALFTRLRKQALKFLEEDDVEGLVGVLSEENVDGIQEEGGVEKQQITLEHEQLNDPRNHMTLLHSALEEKMTKVSNHLITNGSWEYLSRGYTNISCQIPPSSKNALHITVEQGDLETFQLLLSKLKAIHPLVPSAYQAIVSPVFDDTSIDKVTRLLGEKVVVKEGNDKRRVGLQHLAALNGRVEFLEELKELGVSLDACDSWKETPLMWAVQKGKIEVFKELLRLGVDVNKRNQYGCSTLHIAVSSRQQEMAEILIDLPRTELNKERIKNPRRVVEMVAKHDDNKLMERLMWPTVRDRVDRNHLKNALFIAATHGHTATMEAILDQVPGLTDAPDDLGNTPVMAAANHLQLETVKILVEKYMADITLKNCLLETIFDMAMKQPTNELLHYLMEQTKSDDILKPMYLHTAAANGDNDKIDFILKTGKMNALQLDIHDNTIFHTAAANDAYQVLEYFLAKDDDLTELQNKEGETPLHVAVKKGNTRSVEALLERNSGTNIGDNFNHNSLHASVSSPCSSFEIVSMVVGKMEERCPNDLNGQDFDGNTALHLAAKYSRGEFIELLSGLDPCVENINGETALHLAVRLGGGQEVDALLQMFYVGEKNEMTNVDQRDVQGCTALYRCAEIGDTGKLESLMRHGANISINDNEDCSILHRIIERSVENSSEADKYVSVYDCIVSWSVRWLCKKEGSRLPLENTAHFFEVRLQAVRFLTSHTYYKKCNALQYASKIGALAILKAILNTSNVYKFSADCPMTNSKRLSKKSFSSPSPINPVLSEYISCNTKDQNKELYDITFLIPRTKPINEVPLNTEINTAGISKVFSDGKLNKTSCLEYIVDTNDEEFINDILDREPFRFLVSEYWKLCRRAYEVLMWLHVVFMITFTHFTIPSKQFLKHRFKELSDLEDEDLVSKRFYYVKDLGWLLIWPVFILLSKAVMIVYHIMTIKDQNASFQKLTVGSSKLDEITSGLMRLPIGIMLFTFNHLSTISALVFGVSSITWFAMAVFANNPHDYLECLAIVMIFGWMHTISYVKGFKDWNALASILKQMIIKDLTCFIYIYIFVLISFGYAMHVLLQADFDLEQDQRRSSTTIYLTFMRTISPGNLMDISESKDYENSGGRVYFMRAVCACYAIFGTVILMNLLIAMMNSTYSAIRSNKSTAWRIDSLSFALWVERNCPCVCWSVLLMLATVYDREQNRWYVLEEATKNENSDESNKKEVKKETENVLLDNSKDSKKQLAIVEKMAERLVGLEAEIGEYRKEMTTQKGDDRGVKIMLTEMKLEMRRVHELCLETSALARTSRQHA